MSNDIISREDLLAVLRDLEDRFHHEDQDPERRLELEHEIKAIKRRLSRLAVR